MFVPRMVSLAISTARHFKDLGHGPHVNIFAYAKFLCKMQINNTSVTEGKPPKLPHVICSINLHPTPDSPKSVPDQFFPPPQLIAQQILFQINSVTAIHNLRTCI